MKGNSIFANLCEIIPRPPVGPGEAYGAPIRVERKMEKSGFCSSGAAPKPLTLQTNHTRLSRKNTTPTHNHVWQRRGAARDSKKRRASVRQKEGLWPFEPSRHAAAPNRRPHPPRAHRDRAERPRERSPDETRGRKPATRESRRLERSRENSRRREKHPSDAARTPNRRNETTRNEIPPTQVKAAAARARRARARPSRRRPRRASSSRARASRATCAA